MEKRELHNVLSLGLIDNIDHCSLIVDILYKFIGVIPILEFV